MFFDRSPSCIDLSFWQRRFFGKVRLVMFGSQLDEHILNPDTWKKKVYFSIVFFNEYLHGSTC